MKKTIFVLMLASILILSGCKDQQEKIGGQTDAHGCLIAAGYMWNDDIGACVRDWEFDEDQTLAAKIAIAPYSYPVVVTSVDVIRCPGCFDVHIQRVGGSDVDVVKIRDYKFAGRNHYCDTDSDCIPEPVCHPMECINEEYAAIYDRPDSCTQELQQGEARIPEDCICSYGICTNINSIENTTLPS